ncbi:MAG: hypothetical protein ACRDZ2_14135, partial [Ilumatobacteraceae bacterium]
MGDHDPAAGRAYLTTYLRDHRAGAAAGVSLVRHLAEANSDTEWGGPLAELHREIAADREALDDILAHLDVRANPVKQALAPVVTRLRRIKLNRHLLRYSPLSRVVDLELLAAGVDTKRNLWRSLAAIDGSDEHIDPARVQWLDERAARQHEQILALHRS